MKLSGGVSVSSDRRSFLKGAVHCAGMTAVSKMTGFAMPAYAGDVPVPDAKSMEDLSNAVVIAPRGLSKREQKAVQVLIEEVEKRTAIRWPASEDAQPRKSCRFAAGTESWFRVAFGSRRILAP